MWIEHRGWNYWGGGVVVWLAGVCGSANDESLALSPENTANQSLGRNT